MTLVTTRPIIKPLCTRHHAVMIPAEFGELAGVTVQAYRCAQADCTRAYNSSQGYFDLEDGVMLLQMEQRDCPDCGLPMYLRAVEAAGGAETWRCAQLGCRQSSQSSAGS